MEKFNNLLNREDYINGVNEGKIGDFVRTGVRKLGEKVAKFFFIKGLFMFNNTFHKKRCKST